MFTVDVKQQCNNATTSFMYRLNKHIYVTLKKMKDTRALLAGTYNLCWFDVACPVGWHLNGWMIRIMWVKPVWRWRPRDTKNRLHKAGVPLIKVHLHCKIWFDRLEKNAAIDSWPLHTCAGFRGVAGVAHLINLFSVRYKNTVGT